MLIVLVMREWIDDAVPCVLMLCVVTSKKTRIM